MEGQLRLAFFIACRLGFKLQTQTTGTKKPLIDQRFLNSLSER